MEQFIISLDVDVVEQEQMCSNGADVAYEITDFMDSKGLDDRSYVVSRVNKYLEIGLPAGSIMMGAFQDLSIFSRDDKIRHISFGRMRQCLRIAQRLSLEMVIFYVNAPSYLVEVPDFEDLLQKACDGLIPLLQEFHSVKICLENRMESGPRLFFELFEKLNHYNIGFSLNYCRAALSSTPPEKWALTLQPYLSCLRIFDSSLQYYSTIQSDNLNEKYNRYRAFYKKYFSENNNPNSPAGKVLFGYHDLHDTLILEEEVEEIHLLEEDLLMDEVESSSEELLERIFFYMNELVGKKGFSSTILLLTDMGRTLANSERASFWYWDKKRKEYWTIVALGRDKITIEEGTGLVGSSIQNNEVLIINDPYSDKRFYSKIDSASGFISRSILCIPVTDSKGNVIGAFQAINKISKDGIGKFDEQDVKRLAMSAAYCGRTLEAYLLYQETLVDMLTGLKNRRGITEFYEEQIKPNLQEQEACLIMADLDYFKSVNDSYGHAAGDAVLRFVGNFLAEEVGEGGAVGRWGGEEFILIVKNTNFEQGCELAEQLRRKIESKVCSWKDLDLKITMSLGLAQLNPSESFEGIIELADNKLYEAKEQGRNRVVF